MKIEIIKDSTFGDDRFFLEINNYTTIKHISKILNISEKLLLIIYKKNKAASLAPLPLIKMRKGIGM
jgi:hypothetical protein